MNKRNWITIMCILWILDEEGASDGGGDDGENDEDEGDLA